MEKFKIFSSKIRICAGIAYGGKDLRYLKILFPVQIQQNYLILGRSFTLKYPFVFNPDLNRIGFYRIYNKSDEMKVNSNIIRNKLKIIIKISTILILIIIMFFSLFKFGNLFCVYNRKKRVNEISKEYEYKDINNNSNFINKDLKMIIEMKSEI